MRSKYNLLAARVRLLEKGTYSKLDHSLHAKALRRHTFHCELVQKNIHFPSEALSATRHMVGRATANRDRQLFRRAAHERHNVYLEDFGHSPVKSIPRIVVARWRRPKKDNLPLDHTAPAFVSEAHMDPILPSFVPSLDISTELFTIYHTLSEHHFALQCLQLGLGSSNGTWNLTGDDGREPDAHQAAPSSSRSSSASSAPSLGLQPSAWLLHTSAGHVRAGDLREPLLADCLPPTPQQPRTAQRRRGKGYDNPPVQVHHPAATLSASVGAAARNMEGENVDMEVKQDLQFCSLVEKFPDGEIVRIHGLQARPDLNNCYGIISGVRSSTRLAVRVLGLSEEVSIQALNLLAVTSPMYTTCPSCRGSTRVIGGCVACGCSQAAIRSTLPNEHPVHHFSPSELDEFFSE